MSEKEREEIRALYLKRAKVEITDGSLEVAARALVCVKVYSRGDAGAG